MQLASLFRVKQNLIAAHSVAHNVKELASSVPPVKPIVESYESVKEALQDLIQEVKTIVIVLEVNRRKTNKS